MKLHRTSGQPDWTGLTHEQQNSWQRLAESTDGIVTPGNLVTATGFILVIISLCAMLQGRYWLSLAGLIVGRGLDLADGLAADATGTKSPLGEALDATSDKVGTFLSLVAFGASGVAPWWLVAAVALPHAVIALIAVKAASDHHKFHPSRAGKLSMAAAWIGLLGLLVVRAGSLPAWGVADIAAYAVLAVSIMLGIFAASGYLRDAR